MPTSHDEEETLCLLSAADNQEDSPGPRKPSSPCSIADTSPTTTTRLDTVMDDAVLPTLAWEESEACQLRLKSSADDILNLETKPLVKLKRASLEGELERSTSGPCSRSSTPDMFLATRNAERTFFNVCTNQKYKKVKADPLDYDETSIKVVSEILGDLERDQESQVASSTDVLAPGCKAVTSTSLVVDVHIPPLTDEGESSGVSAVSRLPCKHEVNRFQRCYSDGHQSSPKWKGKVSFFTIVPSYFSKRNWPKHIHSMVVAIKTKKDIEAGRYAVVSLDRYPL